jgi:hypothetical protein
MRSAAADAALDNFQAELDRVLKMDPEIQHVSDLRRQVITARAAWRQ